MNSKKMDIPEVVLFTPKVFGDERGFFFESYNDSYFREVTGIETNFVQDNHSKSQYGVLRGLHYQLPPHAQGKLVRVVSGHVFDVAVDIRKSSPTFGKWVGAHLTDENKNQLWIPAGFAHGFITLSPSAEFVYKTTSSYAPESEGIIRWDDPDINIDWPYDGKPNLSAKDSAACYLCEAKCFE